MNSSASCFAPLRQNFPMWHRIAAIASSILLGPILFLALGLAALVALPAIALALPFFLASMWQYAKQPARVRLGVAPLPVRRQPGP